MLAIVFSWLVAAVLIVGLAVLVGRVVTGRVSGLPVDARGRYSLTHLQIALWTIVILSLIMGAAVGRMVHGLPPLGFHIPGELLAVMGISLGSGVLTTVTKATKDAARPESVAASIPKRLMDKSRLTTAEQAEWRPRFWQIYMQEEGTFADEVVDIGKLQNFLITLVLVLAYTVAVWQALDAAGTAAKFDALPGFAGSFLTLLAVSHGAYVAAKIPPQPGTPDTNLSERDRKVAGSVPVAAEPHGALGPIAEWSDVNPISSVPRGAALGVVDAKPFELNWRFSAAEPWQTAEATRVGKDSYLAFVSREGADGRIEVTFTRRYPAENRWEQGTHKVTVDG
ncbi:hypothetical protein GCM10020358_23380 [Amorphoplanes nipponensis]|uniref:Uncharacterized protein n=1 Tax=Actinoplanes nipponensis TaxID=135950 RepID=A0A919JLU6_9ACTN|nr:hypothetical protein [Actinoplanes nipponensis]GIE53173.1 hypothetical protein Ani05nite_67070 [Actinoplanes nipponensis]